MIESSASKSGLRSKRPLARAALLSSVLVVLDHARRVELDICRPSKHLRAKELTERLAPHREVLARRAANVALTAAVSVEELRELREAANLLSAVQGLVCRKLSAPLGMS